MLQVRNLLFRILGDTIMKGSFKLIFVLLALFSTGYAVRKGLETARVLLIPVLFILAYMFSADQPYFSERTHVLTYGLLGLLAIKDLFILKKQILIKNLILAIGFTALISAMDELFQSFLPYRVGDFRDVITNIISSLFGLTLFLVFKLRSLT